MANEKKKARQSKNHHFVPRSLLRGFAADSEADTIFVFDKTRDKSYLSAIENAGSENDFNVVKHKGESLNFEDAFEVPDGLLSDFLKVIRDMQDVRRLSAEQRAGAAYLLLLQLMRVKLARSTLLGMTAGVHQMLKDHGISDSLDAKFMGFDENEAKKANLRTLAEVDRFVPAIVAKSWSLKRTTADKLFLCSDNPVGVNNFFPGGSSGFDSKGAIITWPLSKQLTLWIECPSIAASIEHADPLAAAWLRSEITTDVRPEMVDKLNTQQVLGSSRFIYSPGEDFTLVRSLLEKYPAAKHVTSKTDMSEIGQIPIDQSTPLGQWLRVSGSKTVHLCSVVEWGDTETGIWATIDPRYLDALHTAISDAPQSEAKLFVDQSAVQHMSDVALAFDMSTQVVTIEYASQSMRELSRQLHRPRVEDDHAEGHDDQGSSSTP